MFSINKRGLSEVIGIVIFIILSLSALALVFGGVSNLIKDSSAGLSPFVSCLEIQERPPEITRTSYNSETGDVEVTIKRNPTDQYTTLLGFVLDSNTQGSKFECGLSCNGHCNIQSPGQEKTFYFATQEKPESVALYVNDNCFIETRNVR